MAHTVYNSGLPPEFLPIYFPKSSLLGECRVIHTWSHVSIEKCLNEAMELLNFYNLIDEGKVIYFESSIGEQNTRISRYYAGSRTSRVLGHKDVEPQVTRLFESNMVVDGYYYAYGLFSIRIENLLNTVCDHLFGFSRSFIMIGDVQKNIISYGKLSDNLFLASLEGGLHIHIPKILEVVHDAGLIGMGAGYGNDEYEGFVFNLYTFDI